MPKIVTANLLSTGTVVFLGDDEQWVGAIAAARVFENAESAEDGLAIGQRDAARAIVVDPFVTDNGPAPDGKRGGMTLRDSIRAHGPTIRYLPADLQADRAGRR